jgi:hypothetical protein
MARFETGRQSTNYVAIKSVRGIKRKLEGSFCASNSKELE